MTRWWKQLTVATVVAGCAWTVADIGELVSTSARLPKWDEAAHGMDVVVLADALTRGDPLGYVADAYGMSLWPPLFPMLASPVAAFLTPNAAALRLLMPFLFVGVALAMVLAGFALDHESGAIVGLLSASVALSSPMFALYAALVMLELPGALVLILALASYARLQRSGHGARLAGALTAALFLCKYNYGIPWIATVVVIELWQGRDRIRAQLSAHGRDVARASVRPFVIFVAVYVAVVGAVVVSGGIRTTLFGQRVSFVTAGNPMWALGVIVMFWIAASASRRQASRRLWSQLADRHRQLLEWGALPIALWLAAPTHARSLFKVLQNRSSGLDPFAAESLLFYPRSFIADYCASPWIAGLVAVASLYALVAARSRASRPLLVALVLFGTAALVHPFKEPRFLFTTAPLIWLTAAVGVAQLTNGRRRLRAALTGLALVALVASATRGLDRARLQREFTAETLPEDVAAVLAFVRAQTSERDVLLGHWNGFSPALIDWSFREDGVASRPPGKLAGFTNERDPKTIVAALAAHDLDRVIVLEPSGPDSPWTISFVVECPWVSATRRTLDADSRFDLRSRVESAGYLVSAYDRRRVTGDG